MSDWFSIPMFVAFLLGVVLSVTVKGFVSSAKSKVGV